MKKNAYSLGNIKKRINKIEINPSVKTDPMIEFYKIHDLISKRIHERIKTKTLDFEMERLWIKTENAMQNQKIEKGRQNSIKSLFPKINGQKDLSKKLKDKNYYKNNTDEALTKLLWKEGIISDEEWQWMSCEDRKIIISEVKEILKELNIETLSVLEGQFFNDYERNETEKIIRIVKNPAEELRLFLTYKGVVSNDVLKYLGAQRDEVIEEILNQILVEISPANKKIFVSLLRKETLFSDEGISVEKAKRIGTLAVNKIIYN